MKIRIVNYEDDSWILGKFALRLCENLKLLGVEADVDKVPCPNADINHHIAYVYYNGKRTTRDTVMVTHVDFQWKLDKLKAQLRNAEMGICMSSDTAAKLAQQGLPPEKLTFVNPPHDGVMKPRKLNIGITSKVFEDGRKRESMLTQLSERIALEDFKFSIMGSGWDSIVDSLKSRNLEVEYYDEFDYERYCQLMPSLDYYLYFGNDEGSMGFLDALAAGVKTIVTPQGFHLDAPGGITFAFNDIDELSMIFSEIAREKRRLIESVASWTWPEYASKHLEIWQGILGRRRLSGLSKRVSYELDLTRARARSVVDRIRTVKRRFDGGESSLG